MEPTIEASVCWATWEDKRQVEMVGNSGGNGGLYFVVGALVVVVAVMFVMIGGHHSFWGGHQVDVHIDTPHTPGH
jgi:hypothetical protein